MKKATVISIAFGFLVIVALTFAFTSKKAGAPDSAGSPAEPSSASAKDTAKQNQGSNGQYIDYSEEALANAKGERVLFFHASWCPQCRSIENGILKQPNPIPSGITIIKVDYDTNQKLRQKYGVTLQTTFVKIDGSGNLVDKYVAYDEPTFEAVKKNFL
jgi:thiol-disulfide isomerase/thioredoxin